MLVQICETWKQLGRWVVRVKSGRVLGGPSDGILTSSARSQGLSPWWRSILEPLLETQPGSAGYAQFAAAVVQRVICDWWHGQGQKVVVGWSPMCGWPQWQAA